MRAELVETANTPGEEATPASTVIKDCAWPKEEEPRQEGRLRGSSSADMLIAGLVNILAMGGRIRLSIDIKDTTFLLFLFIPTFD